MVRTIERMELETWFRPPSNPRFQKEWMEEVWRCKWLVDPQRIATPLRKFPEYRSKGSHYG